MAKDTQTNKYWESRTLCSDESCIGVIGPDGRCKECGKKYEGDLGRLNLPDAGAVPVEETKPADTEMAEPIDASIEPDEPQPTDSRSDDDWEKRTLCSDESCIGVIGPDGRCKECGKPFEKG